MPPTIRNGQMRTKGTNAINPDRHVVDMSRKIYMLDSGQNPALRALSMKVAGKPLKTFEPKWLEDEVIPERDALTAAITNVATTVPVGNGTYHKAGDAVLIPDTGEIVRVTAVAANDLTVVRGSAGTTATAALIAAPVLNLGLVDAEGNLSPVAKATITATKSNYTRILKTPVHLSRTLDQVELYGGNERARLRTNAGVKHARLLELEFFHGRKFEDLTSGVPVRYAGGLDFYVTTNIFAANGPISESEFYEWIGTVYRFGVGGASSPSRVLFAGQSLINTISMWGQNKLQTDSKRDAKYGFSIATLLTPYGTLDIVYHPLLEGAYAGYGYVCDMSGLGIMRLQPTMLQTNIQAPDEDGWKDQYLSEQTYMVANEQAFGVIKGVTF